MDGQWLPVLVNTRNEGELIFRQRTFVVPYDQHVQPQAPLALRKALCVVELTIENPTSRNVEAYVCGAFQDVEEPGSIELQAVGNRVLAKKKAKLLACLDTQGLDPLGVTTCRGMLTLTGKLPAKTTRRCAVYIPAWDMKPEEHGTLKGGPELRAEVERYWNGLMSRAMQIELPEPLLVDMIRATQVHCMMAARNREQGRHIEPWIGADRYGPLDTEAQAVILGVGLFGHDWFARRGHEFFLASTNKHGMLAKGYTLMGTGQHLWTLVEHYRLSGDRKWLQRVAPTLVRSCRWIIQQTEKTKRLDTQGEKVPEYGLTPPGVLADWHRYAYYFYANGHYCAGVKAVAEALTDINHPEAEKLKKAAAEYRENLLRAFHWQQARMPAQPLRDGTWVPPTPSSLYCFGLTKDFFSGVSATGHDVEVGGNHLIPLGLIDPKSRLADWIIDYMEDRWFYIDGLRGAYPAAESEKDWFNYGGFAKLQPHYVRTSDIHALRDDVKAFVRTYFNTFPVLLNKENLCYWEHFRATGGWNKTHESGWFLQMTRTMLLQERGNELWLAPFVTNNWLKDGLTVAVRNAPTHFGPVSYKITSSVAQGHIEAVVEPPSRNPPERLVIRLRHPKGKPIRSATLNGREHRDFDPAQETITLPPSAEGKITVRAVY